MRYNAEGTTVFTVVVRFNHLSLMKKEKTIIPAVRNSPIIRNNNEWVRPPDRVPSEDHSIATGYNSACSSTSKDDEVDDDDDDGTGIDDAKEEYFAGTVAKERILILEIVYPPDKTTNTCIGARLF